MTEIRTIDRRTLEEKMARAAPDNVSKSRGYALIDVAEPKEFVSKHIPKSVNVPVAAIDMLEDLFSKDKEIILYCTSRDSDAAPRAARTLLERGFENVYDYEPGSSGWREADNRAKRTYA
jgi:rhodanese-related sulfurtransferase